MKQFKEFHEIQIKNNKTYHEEHTKSLDKLIYNSVKQAGAELGQAQLPTGNLLYCD